jgi:hypothetical protein
MASNQETSTQNTQYDKIGTKYNAIKTLPAAEPEEPSVVKALSDIRGKRCLGTPFSHNHLLRSLLENTLSGPTQTYPPRPQLTTLQTSPAAPAK